MNGSVTIRDIAQRAQVSTATVSRVLNGDYPVSAQARQRVQDAIREMDFTPNAVARSLRKNRTNMVALMVPELRNTFFMDLAKGLEKVIEPEGYNLIIASSDGLEEKERRLIDVLVERRIDALVIASADSVPEKLRACVEKKRLLVVLVDRMFLNIETHQVGWNNFDGSRRLGQYLVENGHRDIALVNASIHNANGSKRLAGFLSALTDARVTPRPEWVSPSLHTAAEACAWCRTLLREAPRPTALFCANNLMLDGAAAAIEEAGLRVGEDISVVSFGRTEEAPMGAQQQVTHLRQSGYQMGLEAGRILVERLRSDASHAKAQIVLDTELCEGRSVKRLR